MVQREGFLRLFIECRSRDVAEYQDRAPNMKEKHCERNCRVVAKNQHRAPNLDWREVFLRVFIERRDLALSLFRESNVLWQ